jgi:hypothetical protein
MLEVVLALALSLQGLEHHDASGIKTVAFRLCIPEMIFISAQAS